MSSATRLRACAGTLLGLLLVADSFAAVIGSNPPARPLGVHRLVEVPPQQRSQWVAYLERSAARMAADKAALACERAGLAGPVPAAAESGDGIRTMPLGRLDAWYGSAEARRVADNIVSFQTPAGGWGKNQPRDRPARSPGQAYVAADKSAAIGAADRNDHKWTFVGTIDNDATVTEIRFLAKLAAALPDADAASYRNSALAGVDYLLAAQFPSGGWPQVWPLQGGYHDAITLNDDALVQVAELLGEASRGDNDWQFLPAGLQKRAADAERRAIDALLRMQIEINGRKTLWAQQVDALSLKPTSARSYEPVALASAESARVLIYLMSLPSDKGEVAAAVEAGIAMLRELAIADRSWSRPGEGTDFELRQQADAPLLWSRFYAIETLQPIFADRDRRIVDDVDEISAERRNGYGWFGHWPVKALQAYEAWRSRSGILPR